MIPWVAAGGALGALARYGLGVAWPHDPTGFSWPTWTINVTGCFLIGVLYTLSAAPRTRAFLGTGLLGGWTTFSTASVDVLLADPPAALAYLAATLIGAVLAVSAGATLAGLARR